jgi:hypothetical protein
MYVCCHDTITVSAPPSVPWGRQAMSQRAVMLSTGMPSDEDTTPSPERVQVPAGIGPLSPLYAAWRESPTPFSGAQNAGGSLLGTRTRSISSPLA